MNKFFLSLLLIVCAMQLGIAQKKKAWVKAADQAFYVENDYYKAFMYYDAALKYKDSSGFFRLLYQKAESARMIGASQDARDAYFRFLTEAPKDSLDSEPYRCAWSKLGDVQLGLAYSGTTFTPTAYTEAGHSFNNQISIGNSDGVCEEELKKGLAIINFVNQDQELLANESIHLSPLDSASTLIDFGKAPWPWADSTSGRSKPTTRFVPQFYLSGNNGEYYASAAGNLPTCMSTYLEHTAINRDRSRVYFSTCESESGSLSNQCRLYYQQLDKQGLPSGESIEISELATGSQALIQIQPAISWDESRRREVLYFVSNRPGGQGGMDIWKSELDESGSRFLPPTNESAVNTAGDEMTPFFQRGVLYFSSNGRPERFGGFDLFSWDSLRKEPENMGQKINSSADDFGYSRDTAEQKAFLVSNRESILQLMGERTDLCPTPGGTPGCCCLSNYTYDIPACFLEVTTLLGCDCPDGSACIPLEGPEVLLYDITNGEDYGSKKGVAHTTATGNKYIFSDRLRPNRKYRLVGRYQTQDSDLEAMSLILDFTDGSKPCAEGPEQATLEFKCNNPYLKVEVFAKDKNNPLRDAKVRLVDITDRKDLYDLPRSSSGSGASGNPCADRGGLEEPIFGEIAIAAFSRESIAFDRTYLVLVQSTRDDLSSAKDTFTLHLKDPEFCAVATCDKTVEIVLQPKSAPEAPPKLEVFFDNARPRWAGAPDRGRNQDIPAQSYLEALENYKNLNQTYVRNFSSNTEQDNIQKLELGTFFSNELIPSQQKLETFVNDVKKLLCQDVSVLIQARGCTSPKFKLPGEEVQINFNDHLQNRRVNSVQRDLEKLGLSTEILGDRYQFEQVYDSCVLVNPYVLLKDLQDQKNPKFSIFSIDAAKARRVELEVIIQAAKPTMGSQ